MEYWHAFVGSKCLLLIIIIINFFLPMFVPPADTALVL